MYQSVILLVLILPYLINSFLISKTLTKPSISKCSNLRREPTLMAMKTVTVGIVGATGAVGEEILGVMQTRNFPASKVKLFASEKSVGKKISTEKYGELELEVFSFEVASKLDVVLLAVGGDFSLEWGEKLSEAGVLVIVSNVSSLYFNTVF